MRGITLGVFSAQPIYDVDFQTNVLDVAQTMGYAIPPLEKRLLLNRLMKDMKDIGFFQIQDTLANFALGITGFEQFRMIDWKKTGNIYTPVDNPIFTPQGEGVEGDGLAAYIDTNFNPAVMGVNYTLNDASLGSIVYKNATGTPSTNINVSFSSSASGTGGNLIRNDLSAIKRINQSDSNISANIDFTGKGIKILNRVNSEEVRGISRNTETTAQAQSTSIYNSNLFLLARQNLYSLLGVSLVFVGGSISYALSQSFRTIYNQFLSNVELEPIA